MNENKTDFMTQVIDGVTKFFWWVIDFIFKSLRQCYYGYQNNLIPFQNLVILSVGISLFWSLKLDVTLLKIIHASFPKFWLSPPVGILRLLCWFFSSLFPFMMWGAKNRKTEQAILRHLRDAFVSAGLKNNDKYPNLIREFITESGSRKLQLLSDGVVVEQYLEKQSILENKLGVKIESIKQHPQLSKVIELEFADGDLPMMFNLENVMAYKDFTFPVGKTRTETILGDLKKIPHYLFAGMTGKGKSTFIKTMASVLLANNKDLEVKFIDLKGTEASVFDGHPRVKVVTDIDSACAEIKAVDDILIERQEKFKEAKVNEIDLFNKKAVRPESNHAPLSRVVVVIDEIAQITPTLSTEDHDAVKKANLIINKIARLGRSFGIHLVVGVQKPDTRNLDSTIKANLEGILCFQVANRAQSQVVLDSNKAVGLNAIAGRAIWQVGGDDKTVQTPFVTKEQIKKLNAEERNDKRNDEQRRVSQAHGRKGSSEANQTGGQEGTAFAETNQ